jgi:hypothetical protein
MRILVHNYSSETSTEAFYFYKAFGEVGLDSQIWLSKNMSAYDAFDKYNPDLFITHHSILNRDAIRRLYEDKIPVVINCTGISKENLELIKSLKINLKLCFENFKSKLGLTLIRPCADIFLKERKVNLPSYGSDTLFVVSSLDELKKLDTESEGKYHIISITRDLIKEPNVDYYMPIIDIYKIYPNYKKVVSTYPSQVIFDAGYYGNLSVDKNKINFKSEVVKMSHTPYNRISELLLGIGEDELAKKALQANELEEK